MSKPKRTKAVKPSQRIQEIARELYKMGEAESIFTYGTTDVGNIAIMMYLDEESK